MQVSLSGHYNYQRLLRTMAPSVLMMIVVSVYSIVDGFFISNFVGTTAFAAVNLVWPMLMMIGAVGLMVGAGGSALVSKTMGEAEFDKANRIFSMLVRVTFLFGLALGVIGFLFSRPICRALGAEGALLEESVRYMRIVVLAMPMLMLQMAFQSFFMTAEKPMVGTKLSVASGLVNILLDALLVIAFRWGVTGAAIATVLAQVTGGLYPVFYFSSRHNRSTLKLVSAVTEWRFVAKACLNGSSEYVGNISLSIVSMCYNEQLLRYIGENGVAAYGVIMSVSFILAAVFMGYNISITPIIGFNYGAQNTIELKSLLRKSVVLSLCFGLAMTLLGWLIAYPVSWIFVGYDADLLQLTTRAFCIYIASFLLCGYNMFVSALFTALNNGVVSAVAAFTRTLVFEVAAVFILPLLIGIDGIWYSVIVAEMLAALLATALLFGFRKRYGYM
ncbi:MAG: MATE family efflux transporter [Bacteroidales bacterium]|nr:MATE family efflux transporter [Bacteroidales bacterium]